jgi:hypothetical protein
MKNISVFKITQREFMFFLISSISALFFGAMIYGLSIRSVPFDGMSINDTKLILFCFAIFFLLLPLPFINVRKYRINSALNSGLCTECDLVIKDINKLFVTFNFNGSIQGREISGTIEAINTNQTKELISTGKCTICCNKKFKHSVIRELYT